MVRSQSSTFLRQNMGKDPAYMGPARSGISDHWLERNGFMHQSISGISDEADHPISLKNSACNCNGQLQWPEHFCWHRTELRGSRPADTVQPRRLFACSGPADTNAMHEIFGEIAHNRPIDSTLDSMQPVLAMSKVGRSRFSVRLSHCTSESSIATL